MGVNLVLSTCILSFTLFIAHSPNLIIAKQCDYPTANLSTSWINDPSSPNAVKFGDGSTVIPVLLRGTLGQRFACGFYCNGKCESYLFAMFLVQTDSAAIIVNPAVSFPQVVWSANRDRPVKINATLKLTSDGDLVLRDVDGSVAWSAKTAGKSVAGLNLTDTGNLVLFNKSQGVVWQSFDHPADALVLGQELVQGQELIASVSKTNSGLGLHSLVVTNEGLFAYVQSNPPQAYLSFYCYALGESDLRKTVKFLNGSLIVYPLSYEKPKPCQVSRIPSATSVQYMRLEFDGHLRVYEWKDKWVVIADVLTDNKWRVAECGYPLGCGTYGICSSGGKCSCPGPSSSGTKYFRQINKMYPNLGCTAITPLNCSDSKYQDLVELKNVNYLTRNSNITTTDNKCKRCLTDCSCKAALFQYDTDPTDGDCYLLSEVFSLVDFDPHKQNYNSSVYLKVQKNGTSGLT